MTCTSENVGCQIHEDNLLDFQMATSLEECRQRCQDNSKCQFLTFYDSQSLPFQNECFLFKSCEEREVCDGCVSETRDCYQDCSLPYAGVINTDNLVDLVLEISSDLECRDSCASNRACSYYTFFIQSGECILLKFFMEPFYSCSDCLSAPRTCTEEDKCKILHKGSLQKSFKFDTTTATDEISLFSRGSCLLKYLLVGGGGNATNDAGGGSGYLAYNEMTLTSTKTVQMQVGDREEASSLTVRGTHEARAEAGEPSYEIGFPITGQFEDTIIHGGDGWSGGGDGGDGGRHDGGSNGGDGDGPHGGQGSAASDEWSLAEIDARMEAFLITPGDAGLYSGHYGGGGGGVLVDAEGPERISVTQGEGYGGGGCYIERDAYYLGVGLPGVILMEIGP